MSGSKVLPMGEEQKSGPVGVVGVDAAAGTETAGTGSTPAAASSSTSLDGDELSKTALLHGDDAAPASTAEDDLAKTAATKASTRKSSRQQGKNKIERSQTSLTLHDNRMARRFKAFITSRQYNIFIAVTVITVLFAEEFVTVAMFTVKGVFWGLPIVFMIAFVIFLLEILICSLVLDDYFLQFYFWLDILATLSLIPDIPWIWPKEWSAFEGAAGDQLQFLRLVRVTRMVRLVRLVRLMKAVKVLDKKKNQGGDTSGGGGGAAAGPNVAGIPRRSSGPAGKSGKESISKVGKVGPRCSPAVHA